MRLADGQTFGAYTIVQLLGRGGMGEVYEATHNATGKRVALKLLRGRIDFGPERQRFLQEGRLAASLSHPHTVYVLGSDEIDGLPVITMQLVPGGTLKVVTTGLSGGWLRRNGVPYSPRATVTEYFDRYPAADGTEWFTVTTEVVDPEYLLGRFVTSSNFRREPDDSKWAPKACKPL